MIAGKNVGQTRYTALVERLSRLSTHGDGETVDAQGLARRLSLSSDYLAARILAQLGAQADASVPLSQVAAHLRALITGSVEDRLRFIFALHDENDDGRIERGELLRMLHITLAENALRLDDQMVEALADGLIQSADRDGDGTLDYEELALALRQDGTELPRLPTGDLSGIGVTVPSSQPGTPNVATRARAARSRFAWYLLMAAYAATTAGLFLHAVLSYRAQGAPLEIQLARGCGAALNLHAALILIPMCRRTLSWLGRTALGRVMIDDHVGFHRLVGHASLALAVAHAVAHGVHAVGGAGLGLLATWAGGTGAVLLSIHGAMAWFARARIRRSGYFELFWITHRLYPLWLLLMLAHGPVAWMWMAGPLLLFVMDRWLGRRVHQTIATEVSVLPSGVTKLTIVQPRDFDHAAGDYVFARIPAIARGEWHPFTISSAPEQRNALTLHVRSSGNWTGALHRLAKARGSDAEPLEIWLDGPYGTPSNRVFHSRFLLLVAAGIGVTPFASILASMRARLKRDRELAVEKAHFVWVCREQRSFEWFSQELGRLEQSDPERFGVRIFMDAARSDLQSSVLRLAMDALYADVGADLVTGLRAQTTLGAPDWDALVASVVAEHAPEPVDCFFCGPPGLATLVRQACFRHGVAFRQEHF